MLEFDKSNINKAFKGKKQQKPLKAIKATCIATLLFLQGSPQEPTNQDNKPPHWRALDTFIWTLNSH